MPNRSVGRLLVGLAAIALVAGACSSDDDGDGGGDFVATYCEFDGSLEADGEALDIFDPAAVQSYFEGALDTIDELADLAPDDLKADVESERDDFATFVDIIRSNDWDLIASSDEVDAFDATVDNAAAERLAEWAETACGGAEAG